MPKRSRLEGTAVEVELIFNETSSEPLPSNEDVVETLVTAVSSPNSTLINEFNLTLVTDSISVLTPTSTTTTATNSTSPPLAIPIISLEVTLVVPFEPALGNNQSPEFQGLASTVIGLCDAVYRRQFGFLFIRTVVIAFSSRLEGTAVEVELIFNETSSEPLPSNEDVVETLVTAVSSPNSTLINEFNLTLVTDSISVLSETFMPARDKSMGSTPSACLSSGRELDHCLGYG
ncbi:hypothetical protein AAFF_G00181620 [Aldrovandia affinis]|uniref:SEA domain-containing protein n=1 Tax=Aldrovandia affinis TaxID=143900 RepID=A0AAD7RMZ1_9TELE|nr:hypothetical protein AAFF_G00181620 [Aldrovandia affinis]